MNRCFSCYEKDGLDKMLWERLPCDETYTKVCSTCSQTGKFVRNIIETKEKKKKVKKVSMTSAGGWNPINGKRERPEHLWKRMMKDGY